MHELLTLLTEAKGITCHSEHVQPAYIFVAIRGRKADGNNYVLDAQAKGALAIVTDQPAVLPRLNIPVIAVADARQALALLAANFYGHPSRQLALIGVTGTNGKTTITYMLHHIFRHAGYRAGLIGTVEVKTGTTSYSSKLTTPDAVQVQAYLAQMLKAQVTHAAMEVSAQGIEMHRVDYVSFSGGILANICPDHLDFHGNFGNYIQAKAQFLSLINKQAPLIVNIGDVYCRDMIACHQGQLVTCAVNAPADITASVHELTARGSRFTLAWQQPLRTRQGTVLPPAAITVTLPLPGVHNVENALLAAAAALVHDIPAEVIAAAFTSFAGVERRMNTFTINQLTVIDDTALNPGSIDAVFNTIGAFRYGKLHVVNAIRGQRGPAINSVNADTLARWQRKLPFALIVTDSTDQVGLEDTVTPLEHDSFLAALDTSRTPYIFTHSLSHALATALHAAAPGDLLLLLGAQGMDKGRLLLNKLAGAN